MIIQKVVKLAMGVFEQKMTEFANKTDTKVLTAELALDFSAALKDAFSQAGRQAYQRFIESYDVNEPTLEITGQTLRRKRASAKNFLTPFGTMPLTRSLYQAD